MHHPLSAALIAAAILATPAFAQPPAARDPATEAARGYATVPSPNQAVVDAQEQPVTQALNAGVAANAEARQSVADAQAANNAAVLNQYDRDRQSYMAALIAHDARVDRTDARYARQQRAYADAMSVWRVQADECRKGKQRACKAPTPNVADYY